MKANRLLWALALIVGCLTFFISFRISRSYLLRRNQQHPFPQNIQVAEAAPETIEQMRAKAEKGDANAQLLLGWHYFTGKGVATNYSEALKWFRTSAEQGNAN